MVERRIHRSMQGKPVDMESLVSKNEAMPAVGNAKMNARGDELGPGGIIVKKREDIVNNHHNPKTQ